MPVFAVLLLVCSKVMFFAQGQSGEKSQILFYEGGQ